MDIQEVLRLYDLKQTRMSPGPMDSGLQVFSGPEVWLRYIRDRGSETLQMAAHSNSTEWIDVPILMALVEKTEVSTQATPLEIQKNFLLKESSALKSFLGLNHYSETLKVVTQLKKERAQKLLPKLF